MSAFTSTARKRIYCGVHFQSQRLLNWISVLSCKYHKIAALQGHSGSSNQVIRHSLQKLISQCNIIMRLLVLIRKKKQGEEERLFYYWKIHPSVNQSNQRKRNVNNSGIFSYVCYHLAPNVPLWREPQAQQRRAHKGKEALSQLLSCSRFLKCKSMQECYSHKLRVGSTKPPKGEKT